MFWQLNQKNSKGSWAETLALDYLKSRGLRLVRKNYACRFGEIDLVMLDGDELIFIEVRFRTPSRFGDARDSITHTKIQKIQKTAAHFLQSFPTQQHRLCRFDVVILHSGLHPTGQHDITSKNPVSTSGNDDKLQKNMEWLKGAFP